MSEQGETPAAPDDWWHRLYEEPPAPPARPAGAPPPVDGTGLDEHFASAAEAVSGREPVVSAEPGTEAVTEAAPPEPEPEPVTRPDTVTETALPEPEPVAAGPEPEPEPEPETVAVAESGPVRPRAWWDPAPAPAPARDDPAEPAPEAAAAPAPAAEPAPPPPHDATLPSLPAPAPPAPAPLPRREPVARPGPVTASRSRRRAAAGVPDPRVAVPVAPAADAGPPLRSGHIGDGPPTYDPEPTALPPADPEDLGESVPDTVLDGARYGRWTLRAASVRGDSARFRGEHRRDALLTVRFGTGDEALILVAVATGDRSDDGAHRTAADACRLLAAAVGRSRTGLAADIRAGRRDVLRAGLHRLADRGAGRLRPPNPGTGPGTAGLGALLLTADPHCRTRVFFGTGPGGLFRLRAGEWSEPAPAAPGDTFRFHTGDARPGDTLLMAGPGFAEPLRGAPGLADELARRWRPAGPPEPAAFLADVQLRAKGYADDRTAVAVHEAPG
ncbi:protein phosphatase 2C domain-containing protein [Streptomyces sp. NPDC003691]